MKVLRGRKRAAWKAASGFEATATRTSAPRRRASRAILSGSVEGGPNRPEVPETSSRTTPGAVSSTLEEKDPAHLRSRSAIDGSDTSAMAANGGILRGALPHTPAPSFAAPIGAAPL